MSEIIQKQDYKQTEVGLIPGDWEVINLGESSSLKARIGWQGLTTAEYLITGDFYLITGTDFFNGFIDWSNCVFVKKERYEQDINIQIKKEDLLVTKDGSIGKVAYVDNVPLPTTLNSGVFVIRPKNQNYYPKYFYYVLMSELFKDFLGKLTAGSTISHLYQKDFVYYNFPVPPNLFEQRAIATALSDTDELLTSIEQLISKKQAIKQGAMQELLTPPNQGGKRLPEFNGEWEEKNLESICYISGGGTPSTAVLEYWNGEIEWFTPTEIGDQKYVFSSHRKITRTGLKSSSANLLPIGSILLTSRASIGDLAILKKEASTNQGFQSLIPIRKEDSEFIYQLMLTKKTDLMNLSSGSTFLEISPKKVRSLKILIPKDTIERETIAQILSEMDKEIKALEEKKDKYQKIKGGMMQELLTGKIRLV